MALHRLRTDESCQDGETCAALYARPGHPRTMVRGYVITDPAVLAELAELNAPATEDLHGGPTRHALQPATRGHHEGDHTMNRELLDATQLRQVLAATRRDLFRMETLPSYDVPINGNDFERWIAGETEPTWENKQPWMDTLTRWAREGRPRRRVRVIHDPITDYERTPATEVTDSMNKPVRTFGCWT